MLPLSERRKLPVIEAADFLGLSKSTLDKLRVRGGGPTYLQVGRRILYDHADLEAWLSSKRRSSTSGKPPSTTRRNVPARERKASSTKT